MRRWFTTPRSTSGVHTIAEVKALPRVGVWGGVRLTRSAFAGKSLAREGLPGVAQPVASYVLAPLAATWNVATDT